MIIGVTGPICAGKDEAGKLLAELGFERLSLVEVLRDEARARGIELTRTNLQDLGDELRKNEGVDVLARKVMKQVIPGRSYTIESIRNPGEVAALRELSDFLLICVSASDAVRFERMVARAREKDPRTFEEFLQNEARDRGIGQASHAQQNEACWRLADVQLANDTTLENLRSSLREVLTQKGFTPASPVQIVTTLPSEDAALDMVRSLLEQRTIAASHVVPTKSLFWWNGKIQEVSEWMCFMKGKDFPTMEKAVRAIHPYEVPEIVQVSIERGNSDYVQWLLKETA